MNHDDVQWNVMGQGFCSYKVHTKDDKLRFCRSPYNLTGRCSRATCPLSNSQYATVVEHDDELYLYIKTAERAHLPRRMWEKVKLDAAFPKALATIDENLQWWDRRMVHKIKARMLRLKQYLMRKRQAMEEPEVDYVSVNKREEFKLIRREEKAEAAARIELEIERELLDRLARGTYDSVMNVSTKSFDELLAKKGIQDEADEEMNEEDEEDMEGDAFVMETEDEDDLENYEMDMMEDDEGGVMGGDMEDFGGNFGSKKIKPPNARKRKRDVVSIIEREEEEVDAY